MTQPPDVQARRPGGELEAHLSLLRRRWLILVGCVVAGCTAGLGLMRLTPPAYTAATQVQVMPAGPQESGNQVTARQREPLNLDTEAQVAESSVVAARAAKALGGVVPGPAEVTVPPNSAILSIAVTAADPRTAAAQSGAYADAYLAHRRASALAALADQQQAVLRKLKQVNAGLDAAFRRLAQLPKGGPERSIALQRQGVLSRQAAGLALRYDALRTVAVTPGTVISRAMPPAAPSSPSLPLYLGTGLMAGLLTGSAAAYARDRLDVRLRRAADVERLTGLPVLADLSGPREPGVLHELASAVVAGCPGKRLLVRALPAGLYAASPATSPAGFSAGSPAVPSAGSPAGSPAGSSAVPSAGSSAASPAGPTAAALPLTVAAPLTVLDGSDVRDLARADAALLLVGLGLVTATQVAAAVRHLARHGVPVIGVVTAADAVPEFVPLLESRPHTPLGKLVATAEFGTATDGPSGHRGPATDGPSGHRGTTVDGLPGHRSTTADGPSGHRGPSAAFGPPGEFGAAPGAGMSAETSPVQALHRPRPGRPA
ncbi:YveK family protein [Nonomuraea sp. NPDC050783]|uniref:YveK family protein n=1 Tax=Nonomuraea sp. NPDC050783 TaxID=3154634 RepID=UPI0034678DB3